MKAHLECLGKDVSLISESDGGTYELMTFQGESSATPGESTEIKRGQGVAAVFIARNRIAVLDKNRQVRNHHHDNSSYTVLIDHHQRLCK